MYQKELTPYEEPRIDPELVDIQKDNYQSFDIVAMDLMHQQESQCQDLSEQKADFNQTTLLDQIISQFNQDYEYAPHPF
jgi:hypothetical protein